MTTPLTAQTAVSTGTGDRLRRMLLPKSAAIVGVSEDPQKYGTRLARFVVEGGFEGELHFVNPKPGSYLGRPFVPSLSNLDGPVDVAMISVPSDFCPVVTDEAAALGCGGAVVVSNGFAEIGRKDLQDSLVASAHRGGFPLIGPNTIGLFSAPARFNALDPTIPSGRIAVVSQSGIIGMAIAGAAKTRQLGLSYFVSVGNQADVGIEDVLEFLIDDEHTDVALLYVEGFRDITRFLDAAARLTKRMPVAILRGGRSDAGARAAASHTGAMADDQAIISAALRRAGLLEVDSPNDLLLAGMSLGTTKMRGRSVSIVSDAGGYATLGADEASRAGLSVNVHSDRTQDRLREILVSRAAVGNPVDTVSGVDIREDLPQATAAVCLEDPDVDGVALVGAFGGYEVFGGEILRERENVAAQALVELRQQVGKPLVVQTIYAADDFEPLRILRTGGVPVVEHLSEAMQILAMQAEAQERAALAPRQWSASSKPEGVPRTLREDLSRAWLDSKLDWQLPLSHVVEDADAAVAAAESFSRPVVLKVLAESANHKSDVGGVILNVRTAEEVRAAWEHLAKICVAAGESPRALVTEFTTGPAEAMVGVFRHETLGPVVLLGTGGVLAESVLDRALLLPPFSEDEVTAALRQLKLGRALSSPRLSPSPVEDLVRLTVAIGDLAVAQEGLIELDLNPVLLSSRGAAVLDARVVLAEGNN